MGRRIVILHPVETVLWQFVAVRDYGFMKTVWEENTLEYVQSAGVSSSDFTNGKHLIKLIL